MKIGEIWLAKGTGREAVIDSIEWKEIVVLDASVESMSPEEIIESIKINSRKEDIVYAHWNDTGEELPFRLRTSFLREFTRK